LNLQGGAKFYRKQPKELISHIWPRNIDAERALGGDEGSTMLKSIRTDCASQVKGKLETRGLVGPNRGEKEVKKYPMEMRSSPAREGISGTGKDEAEEKHKWGRQTKRKNKGDKSGTVGDGRELCFAGNGFYGNKKRGTRPTDIKAKLDKCENGGTTGEHFILKTLRRFPGEGWEDKEVII